AVSMTSLNHVLTKSVTCRPRTSFRLNGIERRTRDDDLPDGIEWSVLLRRYSSPKRMFGRLTKIPGRNVIARREGHSVAKQVIQSRVKRLIIGVHYREGKPRFSATNNCKRRCVCDDWNLTQNGKWSNWRNVEESLDAGSGKEV